MFHGSLNCLAGERGCVTLDRIGTSGLEWLDNSLWKFWIVAGIEKRRLIFIDIHLMLYFSIFYVFSFSLPLLFITDYLPG